MFSDMYIYAPGKHFKEAINAWNRLWASRINLPQLAFHNVFIAGRIPIKTLIVFSAVTKYSLGRNCAQS